MKLSKSLAFAALLSLSLAWSRAAHAQEWTRQSFLLRKGQFELTGTPARPEFVRINLSENSAFKPVEFPVHGYWGVSDDVMIGFSHRNGLRFNTDGPEPLGRRTYNDAGFDSVIFLAGGRNYEVDLHAGVPFHRFSPDVYVGAQVGVLGRANFAENVALVYDPSLYIGVNRRKLGNGDELHAPIWFYFQPTPRVAPFVGTGVHGPLDNFGDYFVIPIEGGCLFTVAGGVHIGGMLRFPNALGHNNTLDWRELSFLGQFRF